MCTFITLIAATEDLDGLNAILARWDNRISHRRAMRVVTPGLRPVLTADEREYWLVRAPCDCGTVLGHLAGHRPEHDAAQDAELARYRRKGWSAAKIARAVADRTAAGVRRTSRRRPHDDVDGWIGLLTAVADGLALPRLGLMHHAYRRAPGLEPDTATRIAAGPLAMAHHQLATMAGGVIHVFDTTGSRA